MVLEAHPAIRIDASALRRGTADCHDSIGIPATAILLPVRRRASMACGRVEPHWTLAPNPGRPNLWNMEIQLNPDQEARLSELAARNGRKTDDLVREAVDRFLDDETRFAEAVKLGLAAAENGDFVASEEVWAGIERALKS